MKFKKILKMDANPKDLKTELGKQDTRFYYLLC